MLASAVLPASAWAQLELNGLSLKLPTRYDSRIDRDSGELSKDRFQYQLSLRSEVSLLNLGKDGQLSLRSLVGTGGSYTSQWNTLRDRIKDEMGDQHLNLRQVYTELEFRHWRVQAGVIPPVKGKVSNTSLDKDGWIRGTRVVAPLPAQGRLEVVTGAIDHLEDPNALQTWDAWNYAEVEWTQDIIAGWRTELGYVYLDDETYLRAEVRRTWHFLGDLPLELATEGLRNLTTPNWAFDVSAVIKTRWLKTTLEYSHVPETFGLLGRLSNDFFVLGHLGMLAFKGPIGLIDGINWFSKTYLGEASIRANVGLVYAIQM